MDQEPVDLVLIRGDAGLGFNICGGIDSPYMPEDHGVFVVKIRENGAAAKDGQLKEGDKILEINGIDLQSVTHVEAVNYFINAGETVRLKTIPGARQAILDQSNLEKAQALEASNKRGASLMWLVLGSAVLGISVYVGYRYLRPSS